MAKDDINFDELDKAVSSVLRKQTSPTPPERKESVVAVEGSPSIAADSLPEVPSIERELASESSEAAAETTTTIADRQSDLPAASQDRPAFPVAPRRRGQFMDVIRPAETNASSGVDYSARKPSTLQPLTPEVVETESEAENPAPTEENVLQEASTEYVDPIAEENSEEQVDDTNKSDTEVSLGDFENGFVDSDEKSTHDELKKDEVEGDSEVPIASPFISGTEVEKRPLGAYTDPSSDGRIDSSLSHDSEESTAGSEDDKEAPEASVSLPAELSSEVVSVESDDPTLGGAENDTPPTDNMSLGLQSITQQYRTEQLENDAEPHPVFDTQQYHQPLTPPEKPRTGRKIIKYVLFVIFMLALGAAIGYIVWVLKLI